MKRSELRQIIREEIKRVLNENLSANELVKLEKELKKINKGKDGGIISSYEDGAVLESEVNEAKEFDVKDLPVGAIVTFKDGETWKIAKVIGNSSNPRGYMMAPHGKTKEHYISMQIEFSIKKLEDDIESVA